MRVTTTWALLALGGCARVFGLQSGNVSPDAAPDPIEVGLAAYYPMDTVSAPNPCVLDAQPGHHDGTCFPGSLATVPGKIGQALHFDAQTNVRIQAPGAIVGTGGFTFAAWLRVPERQDACPFNRLIGRSDSDAWQLCLNAQDVDGLYVFISDGSTNNEIVAPTVLELDRWYHYAITWDGATISEYLDGTVLGSVSAPLSLDPTGFVLGSDIDSGIDVGAMIGDVDDVRIYDRALDPSEIVLVRDFTGP